MTLDDIERKAIIEALGQTGGHQRNAAKNLGISRWSLARRLRKFKIKPAEIADAILTLNTPTEEVVT